MSGEAQRLTNRLLNSSRVTDERAIASELQHRLGTANFRAALSESCEGGSNGWSTMLKAVVVKLMSERKSSQADFVGALSRLIEEADKSGVLFEGRTAHDVIGHILDTQVITSSPPALAKLYWSVLSNLAAQAEYFRAVGREAAQARCSELADYAWATLLPEVSAARGGNGSGGGDGGNAYKAMPASAARLLTRLLLHFPYSLPDESLEALLVRLTILSRRCTPSAAAAATAAATAAGSGASGAGGGAGGAADGADGASVHDVRPSLHKLWAAANAVLRRQAADSAERLWAPSGFAQSAGLHEWIEWGLSEAEQPELLLQLMQLCRLLLRIGRLISAPLPPRVDAAIAKYAARELQGGVLLRPGCVPTLLRAST